MINTLGDESTTCSRDMFAKPPRGGGREGPSAARAPAATKRILWGLEYEGWEFDPARYKNLTGAVDNITYEVKYGPEVSRPLRAAFFFVGNKLAKLPLAGDAADEGVADRTIVVPYPAPSALDPALEKAFLTLLYREAMLTKLVRYAGENPPGTVPKMPLTVREEHEHQVSQSRGDLWDWVLRVVDRTPDGRLFLRTLWETWCAKWGAPPEQTTVGGQTINDLRPLIRRVYGLDGDKSLKIGGTVGKGWKGLSLRGAVSQPRLDRPPHRCECGLEDSEMVRDGRCLDSEMCSAQEG